MSEAIPRETPLPATLTRVGDRFPRSSILELADAIAAQFKPQRIILFGSYAYGQPDAGSDIDLLVVMRTRNEVAQAIAIREAVEHPFPLDLVVRTPHHLKQRLAMGDWFLREVMDRGEVLYSID
ncbi:MAG: nucleotidyltransferase domain-containing protein [Planctomycetes bacterium]|nr:nucleotidyltransferase domain-containing protein [Planctomycetota bacterium]